MMVYIIIVAIIIIASIVLLCLYYRHRKYKNFILKNSLCLKQLKEINSRYKFNPNINFDQDHNYDNKDFYDTISCEDYLIYQLQYIGKKVTTQLKLISANKQLYSNYLNEVKSISDFGRFTAPIKNLNPKKLKAKENKYLQKNLLQKPTTQFSLTITLYCSTINGQIYGKKTAVFADKDIYTLIKRLNNKNGIFYNIIKMEYFIMTAKYGMQFVELSEEKFPIKCDFQFINAMDIGVEIVAFPIDIQT